MNIRLKKLSILLVFILCISIIMTGCGKTEEEKRDEEIRDNVWEVVTIIKKDLKKNRLTFMSEVIDPPGKENWNDFNCMKSLDKYYNDSNTTDAQRKLVEDIDALLISYQIYYGAPNIFNEDLIDDIKALEEDLGEETGLIELVK